MKTWYFVKYRLYGINNGIHFSTFSQYQNWCVMMEKLNKWGGEFTVLEIIPYDI